MGNYTAEVHLHTHYLFSAVSLLARARAQYSCTIKFELLVVHRHADGLYIPGPGRRKCLLTRARSHQRCAYGSIAQRPAPFAVG